MADLENLIKRTKKVAIRDKVTQRALATVHVMVEKRIFSGKDVNNKNIGVYSDAYLKQRRKKGYPSSRKVILQATNQMVNDFKFLVLADGDYGSGFSNNFNFEKSEWVEETYGYQEDGIFGLTKSEEKQVSILLEKELEKITNKL